jgi:poly(3-hydroxybutyrate) depolymerase
MLYDLREAQRFFLEPMAAWAGAMQPFVPSRFASASLALLHRVAKSYPKPAFDLGVPERVVLEKPFCRLVRFESSGPRVLLFAPLSGHFATLLRDTVRTLLPEHEVYITDWTDARLVPMSAGTFSFDDYVAYAMEFMRALGPDVHVMAVCQPSVPVLAAVSLMSTMRDPCVPRSLTLMGGPIDPRESPTEVNKLASTRNLAWFEDNAIHTVPLGHPGAGRRVYPGFLQLLAFVSMNPERHAESYRSYFFDMMRGDHESAEAHRKFYDEYNAVLDMDAAYYLDTVRLVFQEHALPCGRMRIGGELVQPTDIHDTALLTIEGELDDISGLGQTFAAHTLCTGVPEERKHHHVALGAGHYGIFSGRRWRESIYPIVRDFIRANLARERDRRLESR